MLADPIQTAGLDFALDVEGLYSALYRSVAIDGEEPGLGGKLLYAGELGSRGRALLVAGNIAGAASLSASSDPAEQKQAIRDGVTDFLVTSLDEALRILKNEIRKRETVAVCVAAAPLDLEREMLERGVLPDLLPPVSEVRQSFGNLPRRVIQDESPNEKVSIAWSVSDAPARWLPAIDAVARGCFCKEATREASILRRWLRLAPRYLGRMAQGFRVMQCEREAVAEFVGCLRDAVGSGEIGIEVRVSVDRGQEVFVFAAPRNAPHDPTG